MGSDRLTRLTCRDAETQGLDATISSTPRDNRFSIQSHCGGVFGNEPAWLTRSASRLFGGTERWTESPVDSDGNTGTSGTFEVMFNGTSISFFGTTPIAKASQSFTVEIDGEQNTTVTYSDPLPPSSRQWYRSPTLDADTTHTLSVDNVAGASLDYVVAAAGAQTSLSGQQLIVDDDDPDITYSGVWTSTVGGYNETPAIILPHGNSTHASGTAGSSLTWRFSGRSPSLYGGLSSLNSGFVTVKFTVEDRIWAQTYHRAPKALGFAGNLGAGSVRLFTNDSLGTGIHTLKLEVTEAVDQMFMLDFFTYIPAFETLALKPNLSTIPEASSSSPLASPSTSGSGTGKFKPVGAIVGGVIGGLVLVAFLVVLFVFRRTLFRKASSPAMTVVQNSFCQSGTRAVQPFIDSTGSEMRSADEHLQHHKPSLATLTVTQYGSEDRSCGFPTPPSTPPFPQHISSRPALVLQRGGEPAPWSPPSTIVSFTVGEGGSERASAVRGATRRSRVRELVQELQREIAEEGENPQSMETLEFSRSGDTSAVPPPYEPRGV